MVGIAIGIGLGIFAGCFVIACAVCFVGNVLNEWLEQFDQSMMCHLALERTRLRLELLECDLPVPEWLDDAFAEEDEESGEAMKRVGKVIQLHKDKEGEDE